MVTQAITEVAVGAIAGGAFQTFSEVFKLAQSGLLTIRDLAVSNSQEQRETLKEINKNRNDAAKRSSAWLRATLAIIVFVAAFIFPFITGIIEVPTAIVQEVEKNSLLWGLLKIGGGMKVTEASGFVMGPEFWSTVRVICGFVFGVGGVATGRRFF